MVEKMIKGYIKGKNYLSNQSYRPKVLVIDFTCSYFSKSSGDAAEVKR